MATAPTVRPTAPAVLAAAVLLALPLLARPLLAQPDTASAATAPTLLTTMQRDGQIYVPDPGPDRVLNQEEFGELLEERGESITIEIRRPEHLVYLESLRAHQVPEAGRWIEGADGTRTFDPIHIVLPHASDRSASVDGTVEWHRLHLVFYSTGWRRGLSLGEGLRVSAPGVAREPWLPLLSLEHFAQRVVDAAPGDPFFVLVDDDAGRQIEDRILAALEAAGADEVHWVRIATGFGTETGRFRQVLPTR